MAVPFVGPHSVQEVGRAKVHPHRTTTALEASIGRSAMKTTRLEPHGGVQMML